MNYDAPRYKKYPAAENAARGYLAIERLPDRQRPAPPGTNWPAFLNDCFGDEYTEAYERPQSDDDKHLMPTPHEIDMAWEWLAPCKWMWERKDRREWQIFCAYAKAVPIQAIADHHRLSRQYTSIQLDSIFYQIQVEATCFALRGDAA